MITGICPEEPDYYTLDIDNDDDFWSSWMLDHVDKNLYAAF